MKTLTHTIVSLLTVSGLVLGGLNIAQAQERDARMSLSKARVPGGQIQLSRGAANQQGNAHQDKNVAEAWTAACYAEFGPNATNPSESGLEHCLGI